MNLCPQCRPKDDPLFLQWMASLMASSPSCADKTSAQYKRWYLSVLNAWQNHSEQIKRAISGGGITLREFDLIPNVYMLISGWSPRSVACDLAHFGPDLLHDMIAVGRACYDDRSSRDITRPTDIVTPEKISAIKYNYRLPSASPNGVYPYTPDSVYIFEAGNANRVLTDHFENFYGLNLSAKYGQVVKITREEKCLKNAAFHKTIHKDIFKVNNCYCHAYIYIYIFINITIHQ